MSHELSEIEKEKIKAKLEYRAKISQEIKEKRAKEKGWMKFGLFLGHVGIISLVGGIFTQWYIGRQAVEQERLSRKEQFQDKKYALLANFSDEFDQYVAIEENIRWFQNFLHDNTNNPNARDFIGRSRDEVLTTYNDDIKVIHEPNRGEAVLISIRALFHSQNVTTNLEQLDADLLQLQYGDPTDGKLTDDAITTLGKRMDKEVRLLAVAMRNEVEEENK